METFKKYDVVAKHDSDTIVEVESENGDYYKVSDVEVALRSTIDNKQRNAIKCLSCNHTEDSCPNRELLKTMNGCLFYETDI